MKKISEVKKGDYVKRKLESNIVFIRSDYDRSSKTYSLQDTSDMNREVFLKGSTLVYTSEDFEY